ncbi:hypothetical protein [Streptomyces cacaoi]|uniref:hypothetical protein n=1 Tax=Streptomyces cacaoi TaxID=1898 RepID=UPI000A38CE32|nr:hypothetical protein [Streptomyces cacaoi]
MKGLDEEAAAVDEEVELSYRTMREAALSQARYRGLEESGMRPEADVRRVTWWRVRGLWRAGELLPLAGMLGLNVMAAWQAQESPDGVPAWAGVLPVLALGAIGFAAKGSLRAWRLARVARQVPHTRMRYLLLHSYAMEAPLIVLFPLPEDSPHPDEDEPVGIIPLPYGPLRDRFRELPGPVGVARISGALRPGEFAVPWMGEQPLWPTHTYRKLDLGHPRHLRTVHELIRPE